MNYQVGNMVPGTIKEQKHQSAWSHGSTAVTAQELAGFTHVRVEQCQLLVPVEELVPHSNQITHPGGLGYKVDHPVFDGMVWGNITHLVRI